MGCDNGSRHSTTAAPATATIERQTSLGSTKNEQYKRFDRVNNKDRKQKHQSSEFGSEWQINIGRVVQHGGRQGRLRISAHVQWHFQIEFV